jgi:hypothetical protein
MSDHDALKRPWDHDQIPSGIDARRVYEHATTVGGKRRRRRRARRAGIAAVGVIAASLVLATRVGSANRTESVSVEAPRTTTIAPRDRVIGVGGAHLTVAPARVAAGGSVVVTGDVRPDTDCPIPGYVMVFSSNTAAYVVVPYDAAGHFSVRINIAPLRTPGTYTVFTRCAARGVAPEQGGGEETGGNFPQYTVTRPPQAVPSSQQIDMLMRRTIETASPSEHFARDGSPVTQGDGHGGTLTAIKGVRHPTADGKGQLVFFWDNTRFVGWDSSAENNLILSIKPAGAETFIVRYASYAASDPLCCPSQRAQSVAYRWNGNHMVANATPPVQPGTNAVTVTTVP